jgi:protein translocase SecG subunit
MRASLYEYKSIVSKVAPFGASRACFAFWIYLWYYLPVMETVSTVLPYVQIVLAILLTAAVLLQQRGSSMGGAFGGDNFSAAYHTRRGAELFLYRFSIVVSILFVASTFLSVVL